jgi:hypothetical protein
VRVWALGVLLRGLQRRCARAEHPFDETSNLRKDLAASPPPHDFQLVSVGGSMSIDRAAYIYGCSGRKITQYELRYARVAPPPTTDYAQPAVLAAIPARSDRVATSTSFLIRALRRSIRRCALSA